MRPKEINILDENVSLVTEVIEQEYGNSFGMHVDKEKLANISSGVALNDDIAESILNMGEGGKTYVYRGGREWFLKKRTDTAQKIKFSIREFFCKTFTEEILNRKLRFCAVGNEQGE